MAEILRIPMMATMALLAAAATLLGPGGCDDRAGADVAKVKIAGESFFLEVAATPDVRFRGLGGRTHIEDDGGMIFVFPATQVQVQGFVMRDCPIPIDILFLDATGRVLAMHEMQPEDPPGENEPAEAYENRLKRYSSRFPAQFAVELKPGSIKRLGVKEGDLLQFDVAGLKARAE